MKQAPSSKFEAYKTLTEDGLSAPMKFSGLAKVLFQNLNEYEMKGLNDVPGGVIILGDQQPNRIPNSLCEIQKRDHNESSNDELAKCLAAGLVPDKQKMKMMMNQHIVQFQKSCQEEDMLMMN
jgi:hypothetical protein